jgi:hypothetical protein
LPNVDRKRWRRRKNGRIDRDVKENCWQDRLGPSHKAGAAGAAFGTQAGAPFDLAGLLVVFPSSHFFLDAAPLDQLAETAHSFLNRFFVAHDQLNHYSSSNSSVEKKQRGPSGTGYLTQSQQVWQFTQEFPSLSRDLTGKKSRCSVRREPVPFFGGLPLDVDGPSWQDGPLG